MTTVTTDKPVQGNKPAQTVKTAGPEISSIKSTNPIQSVNTVGPDKSSTEGNSKSIQNLATAVPDKQSVKGKLEITSTNNHREEATSDELPGGTTTQSAEPSLPDENTRKASDKTILSEGSKISSITVYRRPSRHISFVIEANENGSSDHYARLMSNDAGGVPSSIDPRRYGLIAYTPFGLSQTSLDSSHSTSDDDARVFDSSGYVPPAISSLPEYALPQRLFSDTDLQSRQEKALQAFNTLAKEFDLYKLIKPEYDPISECLMHCYNRAYFGC